MSEKNILSVVKNTIASMFETSTDYKRIFSLTNAPLNNHYSYTHDVDIDFEKASLTPEGIKNAIAPIVATICKDIMGDVYSSYDLAENSVYHPDISDGKFYQSVMKANQIINEHIVNPKTILELPALLYFDTVVRELVDNGYKNALAFGIPNEFCGVPVRFERNIVRSETDMGDVKYKCLLRDINSISFNIGDFTVSFSEGKIKVDVDYTYSVDEPKALVTLDACIPF